MQLSIIIPARQEMFLAKTVENILENIEADTEIIVVLDGAWADPVIPQNPRVNVIYVPEPIGQRAATNLGARLSRAKYIMKVDAHCSFDKGFDRKLIETMQDDWTVVPTMRNLWAFDWKCYKCGWKKYQGPTPEKCEHCGSDKVRRKMIWKGKERPQSNSYCFDSEPHFQYFNEYTKREPYLTDVKTGFTETMSLQGSCFMCTRQRYWDLNLCDEKLGSWGNQGIEVATKTWLTGGKVIVNHNTWYAHMFRTQGGDFGFPYPQSGKQVAKCKKRVRDLLWNNQIPNQKYPLKWLLTKFAPVKGWNDEEINKLNGDKIN